MNIKQKNTFETCSKNINQFIKYVKILTSEGYTNFRPYRFQRTLLRKFADSWQNRKETKRQNHIVIAPRQCGKTTISAIYILWYALFNSDKCIAILANKESIAEEILSKVQEIYNHLPDFLKVNIKKATYNRIDFENGTYIFVGAYSRRSICGKTVDLMVFDEMAFCDVRVLHDFVVSVFPVQAAHINTQTILLSTPNGYNDFYEIYQHALEGKSSFIATRIQYDEVPGRDEEWKNRMIRYYGQKFFDQEYDTQFLGSIDGNNKIAITIDTRPMSHEKAKSLMSKLKKLYSKVLNKDEIENISYEIKYE